MLTPSSNDRSCASKRNVRHRIAETLGDPHRVVGRAVLQQHAEFVAAKPSERVALAELALQQHADLAQQSVARRVAARVVDLLEAVEIEEEHRVTTVELRGACERAGEAMLELTPVREAGERDRGAPDATAAR